MIGSSALLRCLILLSASIRFTSSYCIRQSHFTKILCITSIFSLESWVEIGEWHIVTMSWLVLGIDGIVHWVFVAGPGQAYSDSQALAPANPSRTSLDIISGDAQSFISVDSKPMINLSNGLPISKLSTKFGYTKIMTFTKWPNHWFKQKSSESAEKQRWKIDVPCWPRWSILAALESLHQRGPGRLPLDAAGERKNPPRKTIFGDGDNGVPMINQWIQWGTNGKSWKTS